MNKTIVVPYGSWKSPYSAAMVAASSANLNSVSLDNEELYWLENRPAEGGRLALVHQISNQTAREVLPAPWNFRSSAHEYGGGSYRVHAG